MNGHREKSKRHRLSALAQLIAIHMQNGMSSTADLMVETGYSDSAIRKAKAALGYQEPVTAPGNPLPNRNPLPVTECRKREPVTASPRARASITTHANNESSSKILSKPSLLASKRAEDFENEIWEATNGCMMDDWQSMAVFQALMNRGADPQKDIIPTIQAMCAGRDPESIEHFGYFKQSIVEAMEDRQAGRTNRHAPEPIESPSDYLARRLAEEKAAMKAEGLH